MNDDTSREETSDDDGIDSDAIVGGGMNAGSAASSVPGVIDSEELDQ